MSAIISAAIEVATNISHQEGRLFSIVGDKNKKKLTIKS